MRVPSVGLPLDERRIIREGYQLAERLLAHYQDKPVGFLPVLRQELAECRQLARSLYRSLIGG